MRYEGSVYRPPSEARSLIIQLTIGCARNKCTFCSMYKDKSFRVRSLDEVFTDLTLARREYGAYPVKRIFLADGDALIVDNDRLLAVLGEIKRLFPEAERISSYGAPADVLAKTPGELAALKQAGLELIYIGAESGDDQILSDVQKGVTAQEIIEAGNKLHDAKMGISMTLISGLGGSRRAKQHALASAELISAIKPEYAAFLTLMLEPGAPLFEQFRQGKFDILTPAQVLEEMRLFLTHVDSEGTVFRSNHASNYISLGGVLNADRQQMLDKIAAVERSGRYKPEQFRAL